MNGGLGEPGVAWRQYHTKLVKALQGHAKVIAFDLRFEAPSEWDPALAEAFKDAEKTGTKIVIGTRDFNVTDGSPVPSITPTLKSFLTRDNWAILKTGGHTDSPIVRQYRMAQRIEDGVNPPFGRLDVVPSLALQVFKASLPGSPQIIFDKQGGEIELQDQQLHTLASIPVDDDLNGGLDLVSRSDIADIQIRYKDVYENLAHADYLKGFDDKLVLVGFKLKGEPPDGGDEFAVSESEKRFGIEIHANALMNLMAGEWPHPIPSWAHYSLILLMSMVGIVLQTQATSWMRYKLPIQVKWIVRDLQIPVSLLCMGAIYFLGMLVAFMFYRFTLGISYHLGSLLVTYCLAGIATK
jgi:CHASE2 domain-containing sensor protein